MPLIQYGIEVAQLWYLRLGGPHGKFHTGIFFASVPSLSNCTMGQMYTNDLTFSTLNHMILIPDTLIPFIQDIGIPSELHSDDAKELTQGKMKDLLEKFWIKGTQSEPYSPWQVRVELCIREVKRAVRHSLETSRALKHLWDYCTKYHCELHNLTAHPIFILQDRTPYEWVVGRTPDISEYIDYQWYETVWYLDRDAEFPNNKKKLGKWLGIAHNVGQALCYYILPSSGHPIVHSKIQALSNDQRQSTEIQQAVRDLHQAISDKFKSEADHFPHRTCNLMKNFRYTYL